MDKPISKQEIQNIENLLKNIDGPLFKRQRIAVLDLIDGDIGAEKAEMLEGIQNLLDKVADIAHDTFGIDCLFVQDDYEDDPYDEDLAEIRDRGDI